jgi:tryptophan halogenase
MKKITIVGRGTVGCLSVAHYLRYTNWNIDWIYDPLIETTPVGEGTNLIFPKSLRETLGFDSVDMDNVNSTPKLGIWKRNWGQGEDFKHTFLAGDHGLHFNAVQLQDYIFEKIKNDPRINLIESNIPTPDSVDSDYVMMCTGSPKDLTEDYTVHDHIPVNAAIVFQCPWDMPKFLYSLTFAKKFGWVFGIPLKNRCAIGYVYNDQYCTEDDIITEVQDILDEFNLVPAATRKLKFRNYSRKENFDGRVCYNGNASYFLEPLEATSTGFSDYINRLSFDHWYAKEFNQNRVNELYKREITEIEAMICLHYFSGSVYNNEFWKYAQKLGKNVIEENFKNKTKFSEIIKVALDEKTLKNPHRVVFERSIGSWPVLSYVQNIKNLGIKERLKELL